MVVTGKGEDKFCVGGWEFGMKMLTIQKAYLHSICFVNGVHSLNHPTPALIGGEINQSQHSSGNYVKMEDRRQ